MMPVEFSLHPPGEPRGDLVWLAHRAAEALAESFNAVARSAGLTDLRDWLVLALIRDGSDRTQVEITSELGIDKTTLVAILDRLELRGYIVRVVSANDRRARVPRITDAGIEIEAEVTVAKESMLNERLASIAPVDRAGFHAALWQIVQSGPLPHQQ